MNNTCSPLENDLSGDGVPSHSNITHSPLGVRADWPEYNPEDFETDSETSSDDEDNETYAGSDNGEPPIDVVDSNIPPPDYDSDRPPDYSFQIESLDNIDERAGSARINGFKDVFLEKNRLELGEDDAEGLSRKYHVIDPSLTEPLAILKIVDLRKAERLGNDIPKLLMKEGDYWSEVCVFEELFVGLHKRTYDIPRWKVICTCGKLKNLSRNTAMVAW